MADFFENAVLGFCWWDLVALIILIAIAVGFFLQMKRLNRKKQDLEDQVSQKYSEKVEIR